MTSEDATQINLLNWLRFNYPDIWEDTIHIANQRSTSIQYGKLLKKMGVKPGVSDLFVAVPKGNFSGLWLELKEGEGKPSKKQQNFLARMTARGYVAVCVVGLDAAKAAIEAYLQTDEL